MVTAVEVSTIRIVVVPLAVVNRNSHLRGIAVVQAIGAAVVFIAVEILWVVDVRVVVEAIPVLGRIGLTP